MFYNDSQSLYGIRQEIQNLNQKIRPIKNKRPKNDEKVMQFYVPIPKKGFKTQEEIENFLYGIRQQIIDYLFSYHNKSTTNKLLRVVLFSMYDRVNANVGYELISHDFVDAILDECGFLDDEIKLTKITAKKK